MHKTPSNALRQAAKQFCREQKVRIIRRQDLNQLTSKVEGKVLCNFGFIHHPRLTVMLPEEKRIFITDYACDCYEFSDSGSLCSHCTALAMEAFDDGELVYEQRTNLPGGEFSDGDLPEDGNITVLSDEVDGEGQRCVEGKALCSFGFIHHPRLMLRGREVADYACDCYSFVGSNAFCPHCRALLKLVLGADIPEETPEEEPVPEEAAPEETPEEEPVPEEAAPEETPAEEPVQEEAVPEETPAEEPAREEAVPEETPEEESVQEESAPAPEAEPWDGRIRTMQVLFGRALEDGRPVCWYPNDTTRVFHPNMGIIGTMGTGKTQLTKSVVTQLCRQRRNNFDGHPLGILIFDYKGDYNETKPEFVQATGARVLTPYHLPFNPFSLQGIRRKPMLPIHTANAFTDNIARIYNLGPKQTTTLLGYIISAYQACGIQAAAPSTWDRPAPTFDQVYEIYSKDDSIKKNDSLYAAMDHLYKFQILEGDARRTTSLFELVNGVVVMDLSGYDADIQNLIVAITLELFYSQMQNSQSSLADKDFRQLTRFILVDEADNFMSQNFPALKRILKEGREFGVGTILSTQSLRHFGSGDGDYSSYILSWVVHNVSDLKRSDVDFVFKTSSDPATAEMLYQGIKSIGKHQSVIKAGNAAPVTVQDTPFWQIAEDTAESYLPESEVPEEPEV